MGEPLDHYELTFLRHGESVGNVEGYFQGQQEFPLTEIGRQQAQLLGERWLAEGVRFDQAISSPLERAKETAETICGLLDIPLDLDPIWMERDPGKMSGLKRDEARAAYPRPATISLFDPIGVTGESEWEVYLRAGKALKSIIERGPGRYLIVSHGGLLNKLAHAVLGVKPQSNFSGLHIDFVNTAFASFSYHPEKNRWEVHAINDHHHLPEPIFFPRTRKFTFLRHGESTGNVDGVFQGQKDYPLTKAGRSQAELLADRWISEGTSFDKIVTSPLTRAKETAEIIGGKMSLKVVPDPIWKEVHNGRFAGLTWEEQVNLGLKRNDWTNMFYPIGETGESWWELYLRMGKALQQLMASDPGHTLIVSHGGSLMFILNNIIGIHPAAHQHTPIFHFGNTGFARLEYAPERDIWHLSALGDTAHLKKNGRL